VRQSLDLPCIAVVTLPSSKAAGKKLKTFGLSRGKSSNTGFAYMTEFSMSKVERYRTCCDLMIEGARAFRKMDGT
jgi:hypothetical protein